MNHSKRTPEQLRQRAERRQREATFPKCACGATLGLQRVGMKVKQCRRCLPDEVLADRQLRTGFIVSASAIEALAQRIFEAGELDKMISALLTHRGASIYNLPHDRLTQAGVADLWRKLGADSLGTVIAVIIKDKP